jgi:predicted RNA-binding Zn-ribbon protein involved in translation (DUF1610 family)
MSRYPKAVRAARMKCIDCNAPVVGTVGGRYVCVECGRQPIAGRETGGIGDEPE